MLRMLVDTCVWRHWFAFKSSPSRLSREIYAHCESFDVIYRLVLESHAAEFLFNALVMHELGARYQSQAAQYITPVSRKIPIPLSRFDGLYRTDGSILCGGKMGGSLDAFLAADGYPQDAMIAKAAAELDEGDRLYDTSARKRELDKEHMESALEAQADLFITNDEKTIIRRLRSIGSRYDGDHPINMILSITRTPTSALLLLKEGLFPLSK